MREQKEGLEVSKTVKLEGRAPWRWNSHLSRGHNDWFCQYWKICTLDSLLLLEGTATTWGKRIADVKWYRKYSRRHQEQEERRSSLSYSRHGAIGGAETQMPTPSPSIGKLSTEGWMWS